MAHLDSIRLEIDDSVGTSIWAEYAFVYAGALGAMRDQGAEYAFEDAFSRLSQLPEPDPALALLAHKDFGKYLAEQRFFARAREQYRLAEKIAESLEQSEEVAHCQMCVIGIELQEHRDPRLRSFQNLRRAAAIDGGTDSDLREAWFHYIDEFQQDARQMIAARKGAEAAVEYFQGVLSLIRRKRSEPVK